MIMKRVFSCLIFSFVLLTSASAQQDAMYTQYVFDKIVINPAFAGSTDWATGTMRHRSQFVGLPGAPLTQTLTGEFPFLIRNMGVGLKIINDKIGVTRQTSLEGIYAYHLKLESGKLSFGLETGMINQAIDFSNLIKTDAQDNALPLGKQSTIVYDASVGVCYQAKKFFAGLSSFHLTRSKLSFKDAANSISTSHLFNHNFLIVGGLFNLNPDFTLEPSLLLKHVLGAPLQADVNISSTYLKKLTLGLSYRTGDAMAFILKVNATEGLRIGYSYDLTLSKLGAYSHGAHEILLSYGIELYARDSNPLPRY